MAYNSAYTGAQHDAYVTKESLINLIYPIGAIYISTNSTSPQTLFGGTWQAIEGKFLVGANSTYTAGGSGGSDKHTHTYAHTHTTPATTTDSHTLTVAEMPTHGGHLIQGGWAGYGSYWLPNTALNSGAYGWNVESGNEARPVRNNAGGGAAILMGKRPLRQTHKAQVRPPKLPIFHHIQQYICGNVLHNKVRYTKGGVTYGI